MKLTTQVATPGGKDKKQDNGGLRHEESLPSHNTSDGPSYTNNRKVLPPGGETMNQNVNGDRNDILTTPPGGNRVNHAMEEKVPPGGQIRNQASLSLANESQFLLLNRASCVDLYRRITKAIVTKETDEECRKGNYFCRKARPLTDLTNISY